MQNDSDNIQVIIRIRPLSTREMGDKPCISIDRYNQNRLSIGQSSFEFGWVADENSSQEQIFGRVGKPMVEKCLEGYNCCIFAYGQTGAGKTYTMEGRGLGSDIEGSDQGLQPRVLDYLFRCIESDIDDNSNTLYTVSCTYLEIYNEKIKDLLDLRNTNIALGYDYVKGLTEKSIQGSKDAIEVLKRGAMNRHVGSTDMNSQSSRSHSVFTLFVERKSIVNGERKNRLTKFHFVDLAGSEKQKDTNSTGERFREACNINKSLLVLGQVIKALGKGQYAGYRDSKLTMLLKDSLGGNSSQKREREAKDRDETKSKLCEELETRLRALREEKKKCEEDYDMKMREMQEEMSKSESLGMRVSSLEKSLEEASGKTMEIEERSQEYENENKMLKLRMKELVEAKKRSEEEFEETIRGLREELSQTQDLSTRMNNFEKSFEEENEKRMQSENEENVKENKRLKTRLDSLIEAKRKSEEDYERKIRMLQDELDKSEMMNQSLEHIGKTLMKDDIEKLQQVCNMKDKEILKLREDLRKKEVNANLMRTIIDRQSFEACNKNNKEKMLSEELEKMKCRYEDLDAVSAVKDVEICRLNEEIARLKNEIAMSEENVKILSHRTDQLEEENLNFVKNMNFDESHENKEEVKRLKKQLEKKEEEYRAADKEKKLNEKKKKKELKDKIQKAEAKNKELTDALAIVGMEYSEKGFGKALDMMMGVISGLKEKEKDLEKIFHRYSQSMKLESIDVNQSVPLMSVNRDMRIVNRDESYGVEPKENRRLADSQSGIEYTNKRRFEDLVSNRSESSGPLKENAVDELGCDSEDLRISRNKKKVKTG